MGAPEHPRVEPERRARHSTYITRVAHGDIHREVDSSTHLDNVKRTGVQCVQRASMLTDETSWRSRSIHEQTGQQSAYAEVTRGRGNVIVSHNVI